MPRIDDLGLRADTAAGWAAAEVGGPATTAGESGAPRPATITSTLPLIVALVRTRHVTTCDEAVRAR